MTQYNLILFLNTRNNDNNTHHNKTHFPHLNLPTTISQKGIFNFNGLPHFPPPPETSPGGTRTQFLVTNFLSFNPHQYKSNHQKQDLLINTCKISHYFLQLQTIKAIKLTLDQVVITNSTHT